MRMLVFIWATLLCSVRGSNAQSGAAAMTIPYCYYGFCISLTEGEIRAEAGLCAVVHCSITTTFSSISSAVWYKCDKSKTKCDESDIIFHSWNQNKVQPGFRGRVSLLDSDLNQGNCSIIINDLDQSDSGSYQFRINGRWNQRYDGFTFTPKASVSVEALTQKLTVEVPPLTDGQPSTLTCTAPGLCSGSDPNIIWTWRRSAEKDSHITGNITTTHGRSSSLTFTPSAQHHGTEVTCKVNFRGSQSTQETVMLNVTYVKEIKISGNITVKENDTLNLTCSIDSFPPALVMWQKPLDKNLQNATEVNLQNFTETELLNTTETTVQVDTGSTTVVITNVTAEHSGQYTCTAQYNNNTLVGNVDVKVIYVKEPVITGDRRVKRGDALNLTCYIDSFPPSVITWAKVGPNGTNTKLQRDTESATLVIHNMTADDSGQYKCTGQHEGKTSTADVDLTVFSLPEILNGSGCINHPDVVTCVCVSEGLPLPTITWPLLDKHTEYSGTYTVSKYTINSTVSVNGKHLGSTDALCVSTNEYGEAVENLTIGISTTQQEEQTTQTIMKALSSVEVVIAFLIGVLLTTVICCIAQKCYRMKQKSSSGLDETVEMMTNQEDPPVDVIQGVEDPQIHKIDTPEEGEGGTGLAVVGVNNCGQPKEVEYATIDFAVLNRNPRTREESTKTEYAEIKKEKKEEMQVNGGIPEEKSECKEQEEEQEEEMMMAGEDEDTKHCALEEEEDASLYCNVKDIMGEV